MSAAGPESRERIGFIGLGRMGGPMVGRLLAAGFPVLAFDLHAPALAAAAARGASPAAGPAQVAAEAGIVITMLPNSAAVEQAVLGPGGVAEGARPGTLLVDMSSSAPSATRRIAARLAQQGVTMLDAPVSGGVRGAEAGSLAIMVGGDPDAFERCRPVFAALGQSIRHVGEPGAGHTLKAINNLLSATHLWSACEALLIGTRAGLDPQVMMEVINAGTGRSGSTEVKLPRFVIPRRFDAGFTTELLYKDLGIALDLAREVQVPALLSSLVRELWGTAVARGDGPRDHTAIIELVEALASPAGAADQKGEDRR